MTAVHPVWLSSGMLVRSDPLDNPGTIPELSLGEEISLLELRRLEQDLITADFCLNTMSRVVRQVLGDM